MTTFWDKIKNFKGLSDLTSIGTANMVGSGISAVFWFYLATIIETDVYGQISYWLAIAGIASVISLLGSSTTVTVYTAKKVNIVPPMAIISLSSSFVTSIALIVLFENPVLSAYVIGYVIFNIGIGEILGRKHYKGYAKYFITQKILVVTLSIPLYFVLGSNGVILGFGLSFFIFIIRIIKEFKIGTINFSLLKNRAGFIANSYGLDLVRALSNQTDKLIIAPIFGFSLLGNYHLGIQFLSMLSILPGIVMQYTLPQDASGAPREALRKVTIGASVIFAIVGMTVIPFLIPIFFPEYNNAIIIVQIISLAIIPRTISLMYNSKFLGIEKSKVVIIGSGIFLLVQIPSLIILGKILEVQGIAWSLVIAEAAQAIFFVLINRMWSKNRI